MKEAWLMKGNGKFVDSGYLDVRRRMKMDSP